MEQYDKDTHIKMLKSDLETYQRFLQKNKYKLSSKTKNIITTCIKELQNDIQFEESGGHGGD